MYLSDYSYTPTRARWNRGRKAKTLGIGLPSTQLTNNSVQRRKPSPPCLAFFAFRAAMEQGHSPRSSCGQLEVSGPFVSLRETQLNIGDLLDKEMDFRDTWGIKLIKNNLTFQWLTHLFSSQI